MDSIKTIIESLSPLERKVIPYIALSLKDIGKKTGLDETSVLRALRFLENKKILNISVKKRTFVELGVNGVYYKKSQLPERKLLQAMEKHGSLSLEKICEHAKISENEFKAAIGALKRKSIIELSRGKLLIVANKEEVTKKFP